MKAVTAGDLAHARTRRFQERVRQALVVVEQATQCGKLGVSYSGGKDSTVTLDLVRQVVPNAPAAFFDSGLEYPGTYEMVAHYGAQTINPEASLTEICRYGGYWGYDDPESPETNFDFFSYLVAEPSWRFVTEHNLSVMAMGLRAQESGGRRMNAWARGELYPVERDKPFWHCCPLAFWRDADVWTYIAGRGLRYNSAYDRMAEMGMKREEWRVGMLLGLSKRTWGRYAWLRRGWPEQFWRIAKEFPMVVQYT